MWKFLFDDEYAKTYQNDSEQHLELVATKFLKRGKQFMIISVFMLVGIAILILLGVAAFLFPSKFTDVAEASDIKLQTNRKKIEQLLETQREVDEKAERAIEYVDALSPFYEVLRDVETAKKFADRITEFNPNPVFLDDANKILNALKNKPDEFLIEFKANEYNRSLAGGSQQVTLETRDKLAARVLAELGSTSELTELIAGFRSMPPEKARRVELVNQWFDELKWLEPEFEAAKKTRDRSVEERNEFGLVRYRQQQQIQDLIAENAQLAAEKVVSENTQTLSRWIPALSVRVGIVILFLFLTRILLETYRYTVSLSAFYRARADALQLLGRGTAESPVPPEELAKLLVSVAPENHRIEKVSSPENLLLALLRPFPPIAAPKEKEQEKEA